MDFYWAAAALWLSAFTSATLLPGTSDVAVLAFAQAYPQALWTAWLVATCGNSLGGMVSYGMGRLLPHKQGERRAVRWLQQYGAWALLLSWVPVVGDALPLAAGWLRLNPWLSALMLTLGKGARYAVLLAGWAWFQAA
ncbi:membrane protein YqaA with SNARE-associated domain [Neisseria sp. HSC-16F19]|nr:YqaA family protein [Neisseria sp. HSC-16F19]MCP2041833.1 membrane protein YqaA with SNARE-associated domain [Neisseria sp. HSC-16F19]